MFDKKGIDIQSFIPSPLIPPKVYQPRVVDIAIVACGYALFCTDLLIINHWMSLIRLRQPWLIVKKWRNFFGGTRSECRNMLCLVRIFCELPCTVELL